MKLVRSLVMLGAIVVLSGCAGAQIGSEWTSGRAFCDAGPYRALVPELARALDTLAPRDTGPDGYLRVPVVIHLMDRGVDEKTGEEDETVKNFWTTDRLKHYFGAGEFSVNRIWAVQARILFEVRQVERCLYGRAVPRLDKHAVLPPDAAALKSFLPAKQREVIEDYLETNRLYGVQGMLNIYLWRSLSGASGYGESPRRNRIEVTERRLNALSTVWVDSGADCTPFQGMDPCQRIMAHELGHALGLRHGCRACQAECCAEQCWAAPDLYYYRHLLGPDVPCPGLACPQGDGPPGASCCCGCDPGEEALERVNACGEALVCCVQYARGRLMHVEAISDDAGVNLCEGEVHSARSAVREFFYNGAWRAP